MVEHVFMSRWGCGPFDNDTAADFVGDLDDAPASERIGMIHGALAAVGNRDSYVDGDRAQVALAAAALVARDQPGGEEFQSRHYGPDNRVPPVPERLISLAAEVVDCLLNGENDVKVDLSASGKADKWFAATRRLHAVLAARSAAAPACPASSPLPLSVMVDVTVEARNDADNPGLVKLQGETWELNIWATTDELWTLAGIEKTDWVQRRTLKVGTCANAPAWWNERDGAVSILVGNDDEAWDIGVTIPLGTVHELLAKLGEPPEVTPPPYGPTLF
jgi:hypothetical protein